ncbi:MAG: DUF3365 domain-containing protein, partial [Nitrospirales bacterium]|nr:DUF3365 domain-containing protein [Nitrospirales bacterium]
MKDFTLGFKFSLIVWVILLIFWAFLTVVASSYLRMQVIGNATEKLEKILTSVRAVGDYAGSIASSESDTTPHGGRMPDRKAIAAAHPNLELMSLLNKSAPLYKFSFLSDRPLNRRNIADGTFLEILKTFRSDKERAAWSGMVKIRGESFLSYNMP